MVGPASLRGAGSSGARPSGVGRPRAAGLGRRRRRPAASAGAVGRLAGARTRAFGRAGLAGRSRSTRNDALDLPAGLPELREAAAEGLARSRRGSRRRPPRRSRPAPCVGSAAVGAGSRSPPERRTGRRASPVGRREPAPGGSSSRLTWIVSRTSSWALRISRSPLPIERLSSGRRCGPDDDQGDDEDEEELLRTDVEHLVLRARCRRSALRGRPSGTAAPSEAGRPAGSAAAPRPRGGPVARRECDLLRRAGSPRRWNRPSARASTSSVPDERDQDGEDGDGRDEADDEPDDGDARHRCRCYPSRRGAQCLRAGTPGCSGRPGGGSGSRSGRRR